MYYYPHNFQSPYIMATYSITINRAARTLTVFKNGQWYKSYPIAVGKPTDSIPTQKKKAPFWKLRKPEGSF